MVNKQVLIVISLHVIVGLACVPLGGFMFQATPRPLDIFSLNTLKSIIEDTPSPVSAKSNLRYYASMEHMAGTAGDYHMANWTLTKMKEYGLENSRIHEMKTLLSYPLDRTLSLIDFNGTSIFSAPLSEKELEEDPTSHTIWRNMTFLGYGPSGSVHNKLFVYANYGRPSDFDLLEKRGVHISGKVVIVRYGECFRGLKVMNAQRRNASAVIIYSDPHDDGFDIGKTYPDGPWRPETSVQRGSVQFNSLCGGDPSRAHSVKSVHDVCGYTQEELIPQIPAIPVSYGDVLPFLKSLGGDVVPSDWQGGLPLTYHFGPSEHFVNLNVSNTFVTSPIWNVITTIPGSSDQDQPVILGNHRDAWVFGAADPNSGSTVMLEVARTLGVMLRSGWRPSRSIILASWSGEEYGLLGSTGWAEEYAETVLKNASVYLNVDIGVSGSQFWASSSTSLSSAVVHAVHKVNVEGKPLNWDYSLGTLGSGSDYTVFLDHLGIASVDMGMGRTGHKTYGVYHSIYDSFKWIETEADSEYTYHVALAKIWSHLVLDFSSSEVLPISLSEQSRGILKYVDELSRLGIQNLQPLSESAVSFSKASSLFQSKMVSMRFEDVNRVLGHIERKFLDHEGLPQRKWFKHILQAPGLYLGYAAQVFPGITQAASDGNTSLANEQIARAAMVLNHATEFLLGSIHDSFFELIL